MPDFELLWTDAVFFLLLITVKVIAIYIYMHPQYQAPWRRLICSRRGVASMVVLMVYLSISLLDSIHMRPEAGGALISVLDVVVEPLRANEEHSYSAPLALFHHSKEFITDADGNVVYGYRRLRHGGASLPADGSGRLTQILTLSGMGILGGGVAWLIAVALFSAVMARMSRTRWKECLHSLIRADSVIPWHTLLTTLAVVFGLIGVLVALSTHYHPLGTDKVGTDVLYQSLKSIRTGLLIGCLTTVFVLPLSIVFGVAAGYFRGWVDDMVQFFYTTLIAMPGVLLIAAAMLVAQVLMDTHADQFCRLGVPG